MKRDKLLEYLDEYLSVNKFDDKSFNGLQVEGTQDIKRILFAVSYSFEVANYAAKNHFDTIIVHHGILWGKEKPITGIFKKRLEILLKNNINLIAYHIPLDAHPKIGNNISIIRLFKPEKIRTFANYKGRDIGFYGILSKPKGFNEIVEIIRTNISKNLFTLPFGPKKIRIVACVSGDASSFIEDAKTCGADVFITGSAEEPVFEIAKEIGINFVSAGHHKTEIFGIRNLCKAIRNKFKIPTFFLDTENPI